MRRFSILALLLALCACQLPVSTSHPPAAPSTTARAPTSTFSPPNPLESPTLITLPSIPSPTDTPLSEMEPTMERPSLTITILYNNVAFDPSLETAWGFSALVERNGETLLFDTGGDGSILARNMTALDIDPDRIQSVILSHIHADHTGGLDALLYTGIKPTIYIPPSFPTSFKNAVKQKTNLIEVEPGQSIAEGMLTTGELGTSIREQALIIRTAQGMVIITGCAHPGIASMVDHAIQLVGDPVYLVMGGFHLGDASRGRITSILEDFRQMGVQKVAPSHCTGDVAIGMFRDEYGEDFIESGLGSVVIVEP